jgi:NitT/TauT family transport system permease protein
VTAPARRADLSRQVGAHGFTLFLLAAWILAAQALPVYELPGPLLVAKSFFALVFTASGLPHVAASLFHVGAALVLAFLLGSALALLPYYRPVFRMAVDRRLTPFVNAFPGIGWTMLAIVWLGLGVETIVFAVGVILLPFMIINLREGLATLDAELLEMARSFSRARTRSFFLVVLPQLYPFVFAAVRVSFGVAWKVTLTAELLGGTEGLGYLMNIARQELDTPLVFAIILLIVALVWAVNRLLFDPVQRLLQRR